MEIQEHIAEFINRLVSEDDISLLQYVYNDKEFIPGETPVYYSGPYWNTEEIAAAIKSFLVGKWISSGEKVKEFEISFCKKVKDSHGVMVNSGSSANLVMLGAIKKLYGWEDNDEIIVSPVGFPTTIAPIVQNNLRPVFIDIELNTLNFDLNLIESAITNKTRAILVSPVLGNPPDITILDNICTKYGLNLILDGCDSLGTTWKGKNLNEFAVTTSYSFYPAHHISTGEGGMVTSTIKEIVDIARSLAWWGRDCYCVGAANILPCGTCKKRFSNWLDDYEGNIDHKYVFNNLGYNLKPLDLQGAIGLVQLTKLDEISSNRKKSYSVISSLFEHFLDVRIPKSLPDADVSWFGVPIICKNKEQKIKLVSYLEANKIQTRNYFAGNILIHPGYKHLDSFIKYKNANTVLDTVFFVGASPHYNYGIFKYFADCLKEFK